MILGYRCESARRFICRVPFRGRLRRSARPDGFRPSIEGLERKIVLSTIMWNLTTAGGGGDWDLGSNWVGGKVPGPSDTAVIPKLLVTGTVYLNRDKSDVVGGISTDPSVTLTVVTGSLSVTGASPSTFGGPVEVSQGASMSFGNEASLTIGAAQTVSVKGSLSFGDGSQVTLTPDDQLLTRIVVSGTLTASNASFSAGDGPGTTLITLSSTGRLIASGCDFRLSQVLLSTNAMQPDDLTDNVFEDGTVLSVPYRSVGYLSQNVSFGDVAIQPGTLLSGNLTLNALGSDTSNLRYVFPSGFTVGAHGTIDVEDYVTVVIPGNQTLTVNGKLNFGSGAQVLLDPEGGGPSRIAVRGTLTASGSTFSGTSGDGSSILINSGGNLVARDSLFMLDNLTLDAGSSATMGGSQLGDAANPMQLVVDGAASLAIRGNDFQYVGENGLIATGDPGAEIQLSNNYWGTGNAGVIDAMILDHNDDATRPAVHYLPVIVAPSATSASPGTATFSTTTQTIVLTASVSVPGGGTINEGTERFSVWNGAQQIGEYSDWVAVSDGVATTSFTLPANTPAGSYSILVEYSGSDNYLSATDRSHSLTVHQAATTAIPSPVMAAFDSKNNQTLVFSTSIESPAGTVSEGTVTFTILSAGTPLGVPIVASVSGGEASATYTLAAGIAGGSYSIQASYSDPSGSYLGSTGFSLLTVAPAVTTVTGADANTTYSAESGESILLYANVGSAAGSVSEGSVTFTILDGTTLVMSPIVASVANGIASVSAILPAGTAAKSYVLRAAYSGTGNYAASSPSDVTLKVSSAATTTTASDSSVTYSPDNQNLTLTAGVTSGGVKVSEGVVTFTVTTGGATLGTVMAPVASGQASGSLVLPAGTIVGTYTVTANYGEGSPGNYDSSSSNATLTVGKATPHISWDDPGEIAYGTPLSAAQLDANTTVAGSFKYSPRLGTVLASGDGQELTVTFTPDDTTNYTSGTASVPIDVVAATPSFSDLSASQSITFGQSSVLVSGKVLSTTAAPRGQQVVISIGPVSTTATVHADGSFSAIIDTHALIASPQPYRVVYDFAGDINFDPAFDSSTSLTVNRLKPVINWADPAAITFGMPLSGAQFSASTGIPGTFTYSPRAGTILAAGKGQVLTAVFTPDDSTNYAPVTVTTTIDVATATPSFTGVSSSQVIAYGQPAVFLSGTLAAGNVSPSGQSVRIVAGTASVDAQVMSDGSFAAILPTQTLPASAAPYLVHYSYAGDANFQPAGNASTSLTVNRAVLSVVASSAQVQVGSTVTSLGFSTWGLSGGDTAAIITGAPTTSANSGSPPGVYPITQGTLSAGPNYVIDFVPGQVAVVSSDVTVAHVALDRKTGTASALTVTLDGQLAARSAHSRMSYRLAVANARGRFNGQGVRRVALRSVQYSWDGSTATVVLQPRRPLITARRIRLVIQGLTGLNGRPVRGNQGIRDVRVF